MHDAGWCRVLVIAEARRDECLEGLARLRSVGAGSDFFDVNQIDRRGRLPDQPSDDHEADQGQGADCENRDDVAMV